MIQLKILALLKTASIVTYLVVFLGGVILSVGSCTFVRLPVAMGYVGAMARSRRGVRSIILIFAVGLIIGYTLYGIALGYVASVAKHILRISAAIYYLLGSALIALAFYQI